MSGMDQSRSWPYQTLGSCRGCSIDNSTIPSWQRGLVDWRFQIPQVRPSLRTRAAKRRQYIAGVNEPELCYNCENICLRSRWISSSIFPFHLELETFHIADDVIQLRMSALNGCHMCIILYGFIAEKVVQEELNVLQESKGGALPVRIHVFSKSMIMCVDGLRLLSHPDSYLGLRRYPNFEASSSDIVNAARQELSTGSDSSLALVKHWIDECVNKHEVCRLLDTSNNTGESSGQFLPKRLIDVRPEENYSIARLHISNGSEKDRRYLALSHCWGKRHILSLTGASEDQLKTKIEMEELPKTYKEAVDITRRLGLRYLWVDSLCIIQDSEADWESQSAVMGNIYQGAFCTIAASGASDSTQGCYFSRNPSTYISYRVGRSSLGLEPDTYLHHADLQLRREANAAEDFAEAMIKRSPLSKRGWVVQERLLSPRTIQFGSQQLIWQCTGYTVSENFPLAKENSRTRLMPTDSELQYIGQCWGQGTHWNTDLIQLESIEKRLRSKVLAALSELYLMLRNLEIYWANILEVYTAAQLTYDKDKLIALLGVANVIKRHTGFPYIAGLWEPSLSAGLLWFIKGDRQSKRLSNPQIPSWSWASVNGTVQNVSHYANNITCQMVLLETNSPTVDSIRTTLKLRGQLKPAKWKSTAGYLASIVKETDPPRILEYRGNGQELIFLCNEDGSPVGFFLPDTDEDLMENLVCFRIVVQLPPYPHEKWLQNTCPYFVRGLVLKPSGNNENEYSRIGYFELDDTLCKPIEWFSGCPEQEFILF